MGGRAKRHKSSSDDEINEWHQRNILMSWIISVITLSSEAITLPVFSFRTESQNQLRDLLCPAVCQKIPFWQYGAPEEELSCIHLT